VTVDAYGPEPLPAAPSPDDEGSIRMRRVLPSSGWSLAGTTVMAAYSFLLLGFMLRTLGPEAFAPWAAAVALLGYVSLLDAGLSATTTRDAAHAAAGDAQAIARVKAANALYAAVAVVALALGTVGAFAVPRFLGLEDGAGLAAGLVTGLLALDFTIVLATAGWVGILRGYQRYDLILACNLAHAVVGGLVVVATIGTYGMVGAALGQIAGRLASRTVLLIALGRHVRWFHVAPGIPSRGRIRALWAFSLPVFALQLATQIGVGTDIVIVGTVAGAASIGLYAAGSQLVRNVAYLVLPVLSVLLPTLSRATFEDALSTARQIPTLIVMAGILGGATFGGLAAEAGPVVELWTGQQPPLSIAVLTAYAIAFVLITPVQVLVLAVIATGRHSLIGAVVLADSILNVILSVILSQIIGPIGVAVSTLVVVAFDDGLVVPVLASRRLGLRVRSVLIALYGGVAIGLGIVVLGQVIPVDGIPGLFVRIGACGAATVVAIGIAWKRSVLTAGAVPAPSPASR
jgi:O-antigen/teichoic acid export membrane protein